MRVKSKSKGKKLKQTLKENGIEVSRCRICKMTNEENRQLYKKELSIHHIDGNNKNDNIRNIIPICHACHFAIHRKITDNTRKKHSELRKGLSWDKMLGKERADKLREGLAYRNKTIFADKLKGKPKSEEHKNNMSLAKIGISYNQKYGEQRAKEIQLKHSQFMKNYWAMKRGII